MSTTKYPIERVTVYQHPNWVRVTTTSRWADHTDTHTERYTHGEWAAMERDRVHAEMLARMTPTQRAEYHAKRAAEAAARKARSQAELEAAGRKRAETAAREHQRRCELHMEAEAARVERVANRTLLQRMFGMW